MVKRSFLLNLTNVQEKFEPLRETPEKRLKSMLNPEDSGGTQEPLSFAVIGPDGSPISPSSFRSADLDIAEILEKKYDTDESIPSDTEPQIFSTPKSNDSGIEMGSSSYTPTKLILTNLFPKFDSSYNNTGRFYSSETYDSDSSTESTEKVNKLDDIPLRSIHNCSNEVHQNWHEATSSAAKKEYEVIRDAKPHGSFSTSRKPYNMLRNRYNDVPCYDHSRVKIRDTYLSDDNDYINASYADGFNKRRAFICTQGPQQNTISHFWQMIWENNSRIVVMTTRLMERGKVKCHKYWPKKAGEVQNWGAFSVKNIGETLTEEHFIRQTLEVSYQCQTRTVYHYKFTQWPDFGIPKSPKMLLDFQNHINTLHAEIKDSMKSIYDPPIPADEDAFETSPIVIHCSAGIGRTGTYLTIAICREWLKHCQSVNLAETVKRLRSQRAFAVQTAEQYQFCLQALKEDYASNQS
jgi:protein tyrosine phosphatase